MKAMQRLIRYSGDLEFRLPPGWDLGQTFFKDFKTVDQSPKDRMMEAMAQPIGVPPLQEILNPRTSVAIVIDDKTRPTPVSDLLPVVLELIEAQGIPPSQVDIIIGNGTHLPMSDEEIEARVGRETYRKYRISNHDARSPDLVVMGEVEGYGPVSFNPRVAGSDIKITLGSISPHIHNGFGGGPKNIMPGVCDFNTIRRHHLKNYIHPGSRIGITKGNPFLQDTIQIARLARVDFTVQCLYDCNGRIFEVLAGDLFAVHEAGIKRETEMLGIPLEAKSDITIASSFPYDEGLQIMKVFLPAAMVTRPGGRIFIVTEASEPLPEFFLQSVRKVWGVHRDEARAEIIQKLKAHEPLIKGAGIDFTGALVLIFSVSLQFKLTLVGSEVLREAASLMGYDYAPDLDTALMEEHENHRPRAMVNVIPAGGYIFPIIQEPFYLFGDMQ
jgi:nickel-dependent lactate racemase